MEVFPLRNFLEKLLWPLNFPNLKKVSLLLLLHFKLEFLEFLLSNFQQTFEFAKLCNSLPPPIGAAADYLM